MPGIKLEDLDEIFTYHAPLEGEPEKYERIRAAAKDFARVILESTPPCPDQSVAIRKVREAVYCANGSIALKGQY